MKEGTNIKRLSHAICIMPSQRCGDDKYRSPSNETLAMGARSGPSLGYTVSSVVERPTFQKPANRMCLPSEETNINNSNGPEMHVLRPKRLSLYARKSVNPGSTISHYHHRSRYGVPRTSQDSRGIMILGGQTWEVPFTASFPEKRFLAPKQPSRKTRLRIVRRIFRFDLGSAILSAEGEMWSTDFP